MDEFSRTEFLPAELFIEMADRIRQNAVEEFGGAILIVPPYSADGSAGEAIQLLIIDPNRDIANFWSTVKARAGVAADYILTQQQAPRAGGYR